MPIVRKPSRCVAPNAFQVNYAVWKLFVDHSLPTHPSRSFTSTSSARQTADAAPPAPDSADVDDNQQEPFAINRHFSNSKIPLREVNFLKPRGNVLREELERTRNANRDAIVRKLPLEDRRTDSQVWRPEHPDLTPQRREKLKALAYRAAQKKELAARFPMDNLPQLVQKTVKGKSKSKSDTGSDHPRALQQLNGTAATWKGDKLEYEGKYVLPTMSTTISATDFPWIKGQEETWGEER
jgi:hypothetical protein